MTDERIVSNKTIEAIKIACIILLNNEEVTALSTYKFVTVREGNMIMYVTKKLDKNAKFSPYVLHDNKITLLSE